MNVTNESVQVQAVLRERASLREKLAEVDAWLADNHPQCLANLPPRSSETHTPTEIADADAYAAASGHAVQGCACQDNTACDCGAAAVRDDGDSEMMGYGACAVLLPPECADDGAKDHLDRLMAAFCLYLDRRGERREQWTRAGLRGQCVYLLTKAERAFEQAMTGEAPNPDHFIDMINYAVFALRLIGDLNGQWHWDGTGK